MARSAALSPPTFPVEEIKREPDCKAHSDEESLAKQQILIWKCPMKQNRKRDSDNATERSGRAYKNLPHDLCLPFRVLTFDMSGGRKHAKRAGVRPLDGVVRCQSARTHTCS